MKKIILFIILCVVLSSCKTTEIVTAPIADQHYHSEDAHRVHYVHDTTYIDRWHTEYQKGDTVFVHDSIYKYAGQKNAIHDTITVISTDTIHDPVIIEKPLSDKDKFFIKSGKALYWVLGAVVLAFVLYLILAFVKK